MAFAGNFAPAGYRGLQRAVAVDRAEPGVVRGAGAPPMAATGRRPLRFRTCAAATSSAPAAETPIGTEVGQKQCEPDEWANTHPAWRPGGALRQPPAVAGDGVSDRAARDFPNARRRSGCLRHRFSVRSSALPEPSSRAGWALCDGSILAISQNTALFALLGTFYGGNGTTTFRLPDLRDKIVIGAGNGITLGTTIGANSLTVTAGELPAPQPRYIGALVTPGQLDTWTPLVSVPIGRRLSDRLEERRRR